MPLQADYVIILSSVLFWACWACGLVCLAGSTGGEETPFQVGIEYFQSLCGNRIDDLLADFLYGGMRLRWMQDAAALTQGEWSVLIPSAWRQGSTPGRY